MPQAAYWPLGATKLKLICLKMPVKFYPRKKFKGTSVKKCFDHVRSTHDAAT